MIQQYTCAGCGTKFEAEDWRYRKYCSKKCKGTHYSSGHFKIGRIETEEQKKLRVAALIASNPSRMTGKKHKPETIALMREVHKFPYNYIHGSYRDKIPIIACTLCNTTNDRLIIHHKDKNRINNEITNLIVLCRKCHAKVHFPDGRFGKNIRKVK